MTANGILENAVEIGSGDFMMARFVNGSGEFKELSDILAGFGAGDKNRCKRKEVKVAFETIEDFVGGSFSGFGSGVVGIFSRLFCGGCFWGSKFGSRVVEIIRCGFIDKIGFGDD